MSLTKDIINGITGNLATDCVHWVGRRVANTTVARDIEAKLNPDGQHSKTRAILEVAMTDALREMKLTGDEYAAWKSVLLHPENRLQLIGWVLDWEENPKPRIEEWSLENAPHPGRLHHVLKTLHAQIQIAKKQHLDPGFFNVLNELARHDAKLDGLFEQGERVLDAVRSRAPLAPEPRYRYPAPWVKPGARRPTDPFVGRTAELAQLCQAMADGQRAVCVLGPGGQGKSSLLAAWRDPMNEAAGSVGLYWSQPYDHEFSFDQCLGDLHYYLTGAELDRPNLSAASRVARVCELLREHPCIIVFDGLERWLVRWWNNPDATADDASDDDKRGAVAGLDAFLLDALSWPRGGALVIASRALPHALKGRPHIAIGRGATGARDATLPDFTPDETRALFDHKELRAADDDIAAVTQAWNGHAYALRLIAQALAELYGGDGTKWREVSPFDDADFNKLLDAIVKHHAKDRALLDTIACHLGPTPIELLAALCEIPEAELRRRLAALHAWQLTEFDGARVDQHALIRAYLRERLGDEARHTRTRTIAGWWAEQPVPAKPQSIDELRPRLTAAGHALDARDADLATELLYTNTAPESDYTPDAWLRMFGLLTECIAYNGQAITLCEALVEGEGRSELRNALAGSYINRGIALRASGELAGALSDYGRAIAIREALVEGEGRSDLRNDLAGSYNNRGNALADSGELAGTLSDYARAIAIREALVEGEGRSELRNELAASYNNRGLALAASGELAGALSDYGRAIALYEALVEGEGRSELRNELASSYNNRGNAFRASGDLARALSDYGRAIAIREALVEGEGHTELRNALAGSYNNRGVALGDSGELAGALSDYGRAIAIHEALVEGEGRRELRNDLAGSYNNRGLAFRASGDLAGALSDYGRAIAIREALVEGEGRRELRNALASNCNNRGNALRASGEIAEALSDYGRAIALYEALVEGEGRNELRNGLETALFNRAVLHVQAERWPDAAADLDRGIGLLRACMAEGQTHLLPGYLQTLRFYCLNASPLDRVPQAAAYANEALRWLVSALDAGPANGVLAPQAERFLDMLASHADTLTPAGLDLPLRDRVASLLAR